MLKKFSSSHKLMFMETQCSHCNKPFQTYPYKIKRHKNLFCSTRCQHNFNRKRVDLICRICNKKFQMIKSRVENQKECFCSKKCADKALIVPRITRKCIHCSKEFSFLESRLKHSNKQFCSSDCQFAHKRNRVERICRNCSKLFEITRSQEKEGRGKYCSKDCYVEYAVWENSPSFKHGHGCQKKWVKLNRPKHCQICNKTKKVDLHHIDENPFNNSFDNFIFVCRSCHSTIHKLSGHFDVDIKFSLKLLKRIKEENIDQSDWPQFVDRLLEQ